MSDFKTNPWETDPDAWKEPEKEVEPNNPNLRARPLKALDEYIDFLSYQNELGDSTGMSDREWIYFAENALRIVRTIDSISPGLVPRGAIEHLEQMIRDAGESSREVGMIEARLRTEIIDATRDIRGALEQ
ncbi:MAG: hypothetical protein G01um101477_244 [Candidatus Doudnabacteria bacterium Gr01-1014_77]|uniref:Uncharacterized protein n=1 Tax=Candidatus Doudnabacteria bacterium Gr01-1014_77 TaxID=2017133 RepID=A0A554JCN8_9BACT|nr:MAG: hypothetical protein G01um101477_244 [Candidatus Doudnabacteria bacterium Gr01-1014_77]